MTETDDALESASVTSGATLPGWVGAQLFSVPLELSVALEPSKLICPLELLAVSPSVVLEARVEPSGQSIVPAIAAATTNVPRTIAVRRDRTASAEYADIALPYR